MYKISVPLMASAVNEINRATYAELCRRVGARRVFLARSSVREPILPSLSENIVYFKEQGLEVGIWTNTVGHGFVLSHATEDEAFTPIVDITGSIRLHTNCPLDRSFQEYIGDLIARFAQTGADMVLLDDDFRLSQHGGELCCACERHLALMSEILGERVDLEAIRPHVLSGKANRYRDAWVRAQEESLVALARAIRERVDAVAPDLPVWVCTALSPWNVDGVDMVKVAKILAGNSRPLMRLTGAPYWATKRKKYPLIAAIEIARMMTTFAEGSGIELMSEGDGYPRPRYTCPASYLELYDGATRIDGGYDGILKYVFDYVADPGMEMGYIVAHSENADYLRRLSELFSGGANAGVRVFASPHLFRGADLGLGGMTENSPRPTDGTLLGCCSIPTVYRGRGMCNSVFGENAREFDTKLLEDGTMLDATSAMILTERGVDVGLVSYGKLEQRTVSYLCTRDATYKSYITDGVARVLPAVLSEGAEPLLFDSEPRTERALAYRYENASGQRFLVLLIEGDSIFDRERGCVSGLNENPVLQRVLTEALPWLAQAPLPAYSTGNPNLYLMCRREEGSMSVALFNCFADALLNPRIYLDRPYKRIECLGCEAVTEGSTVRLTSRLYGFCSAAFRVFDD